MKDRVTSSFSAVSTTTIMTWLYFTETRSTSRRGQNSGFMQRDTRNGLITAFAQPARATRTRTRTRRVDPNPNPNPNPNQRYQSPKYSVGVCGVISLSAKTAEILHLI